ncbi:DEAD/DEAH box helicase domain protein [Ignisphaera aggregans DSM 17230]|uniref:DEAD/DEAH box helicase domain protein n=1 Tax=Ignisphaera aggregans (strain DSM 17230 / JCM 13409 / AQ1.S1) TaxID=583356 RepID=E0SPW3_IGNAA|nr:DEAD/DEAH box helicase domain protein [Ignisphaera aggregans DSM 17230]
MSIDRKILLLKDLITKLGYKRLTEIQLQAFPKILLSDNDILISAPTGSGKTEAAVIPSIAKFIDNLAPISILYITPLRALNRDITRRLASIGEILKLYVDVWHGDTSQSNRKKILKSPPNILVTTPESLQVLLVRQEFTDFLKNLKTIIVDELQEIISSERGVELILLLERIDKKLNRHVRRIAISSPLEALDRISRYFFGNHKYEIIIARASSKVYDIDVKMSSTTYENGIFDITDVANVINNIANSNMYRQILVFTNTRVSAEELGFYLASQQSNSMNKIGLHHGSLSRNIRELIEEKFKHGDIKLVVSTSSLELGIDIGTVDLVIQYLSPRQAIKLIQRVGRSGHREDLVSKGIIVVPPIVTELLESIVIARRTRNRILEPLDLHYNSLDVLAHQIIGIAIEYEKINPIEIWNIISSVQPYNNIEIEKIEKIINLLNSIGMLKCSENYCEVTKKGYIYYLTTNMIPDTTHFHAKSIIDDKIIGTLDEDFVVTCNIGDTIVLGGKVWNIANIDLERRIVWLSPPESSESITLPKWVGENIPVYRNVARETCAFIRRFCNCINDKCLDNLYNFYSINNEVRTFLEKYRDKICRIHPSDSQLTVEISYINSLNQTIIGFYHCLGTRASEAFSLLVSAIIKQLLGLSTSYKSHQLGSIILINGILTSESLSAMLKKLIYLAKNEDIIKEILFKEIKNTHIFKWKLIEVARKFGIISKDADASEIKRMFEGLMHIDLVVEETLREILTDNIDIDEVIKYLKSLIGKRIRIIKSLNPSPYLVELSSLGTFGSIIKSSLLPKDVLIELARRRLLERNVKLMCSLCYNIWEINIKDTLSKCSDVFKCYITCPQCGSRAITIVNEEEKPNKIKEILNKIKKGLELKEEERHIVEKHRKIINMIMENGLAFIIALQGRGIGIEYAKKILARSKDLNDLIMNIVEQEKIYLRTSQYWT